jgi:hypothetical protein
MGSANISKTEQKKNIRKNMIKSVSTVVLLL